MLWDVMSCRLVDIYWLLEESVASNFRVEDCCCNFKLETKGPTLKMGTARPYTSQDSVFYSKCYKNLKLYYKQTEYSILTLPNFE
jgi:hypothetical protein